MTDQNASHAPKAQDGNAPKVQAGPAKKNDADEIQHFDHSFVKLVQRENADGDKEWVEAMSDNLYPGEKLKRVVDEERAAEKAENAEAEAHREQAKKSTDKK